MSNDSELSNDSTPAMSWIRWYCRLSGNELLCEVDRAYIIDSFNLFGIKQYVGKYFNKALKLIVDNIDSGMLLYLCYIYWMKFCLII